MLVIHHTRQTCVAPTQPFFWWQNQHGDTNSQLVLQTLALSTKLREIPRENRVDHPMFGAFPFDSHGKIILNRPFQWHGCVFCSQHGIFATLQGLQGVCSWRVVIIAWQRRSGDACIFDPDDPESCNCSSSRPKLCSNCSSLKQFV